MLEQGRDRVNGILKPHISGMTAWVSNESSLTERQRVVRHAGPVDALVPADAVENYLIDPLYFEKHQLTHLDNAMRVLVVDDNRDAAIALALLVQLWNYHVMVAYDGQQALTLERQFRPHAVLLDIGLPELSGYEVARRLRAFERDEALLLVAITGYGRREDVARAMAAGFDEHMVKPANPMALERTLKRFDKQRDKALASARDNDPANGSRSEPH